MISSIRLNAGSGNFRKAVAKSWIPIGLAGACVVMLHPAQCQYIAWHLSTRASFATSLLPRRRSLLRSGRYVVCFVVGRPRQRAELILTVTSGRQKQQPWSGTL